MKVLKSRPELSSAGYNRQWGPCTGDVGWTRRTPYLTCWWLRSPGLFTFAVLGVMVILNSHEPLLAGMKTTVSEAEHPLLCEGTRREKGDLALALMITYKDDQAKLKKVRV